VPPLLCLHRIYYDAAMEFGSEDPAGATRFGVQPNTECTFGLILSGEMKLGSQSPMQL
jgi:hypothetical protein